MEPPAPPRLSTTTACLSAPDRSCAKGRATISVGPPAGKGTTSRSEWSGHDCAYSGVASNARAMKRPLVKWRIFDRGYDGTGELIRAREALYHEDPGIAFRRGVRRL